MPAIWAAIRTMAPYVIRLIVAVVSPGTLVRWAFGILAVVGGFIVVGFLIWLTYVASQVTRIWQMSDPIGFRANVGNAAGNLILNLGAFFAALGTLGLTGLIPGVPIVPPISGPPGPVSASLQAFASWCLPAAVNVTVLNNYPAALPLVLCGIPLNEQGLGPWPGNNGYGIKCNGWPPSQCTGRATWEVINGQTVQTMAPFRNYPSPEASMLDFIQFIQGSRYANAWTSFLASGQPQTLITGIWAVGYATDPQWPQKIMAKVQLLQPLLMSLLQPPASVGGCNRQPSQPNNLALSIQTDFGVQLIGFDNTHLVWGWDQLCRLTGSNFTSLVRGANILVIVPAVDTQQVGCAGGTSVRLGAFTPQPVFVFIMTHELGHFIENCDPQQAHRAQFLAANAAEGGVTYYARMTGIDPNCPRSVPQDEDYADSTAIYLNPGNNTQTARCAGSQTNPDLRTSFPMHYAVMQQIYGVYP